MNTHISFYVEVTQVISMNVLGNNNTNTEILYSTEIIKNQKHITLKPSQYKSKLGGKSL